MAEILAKKAWIIVMNHGHVSERGELKINWFMIDQVEDSASGRHPAMSFAGRFPHPHAAQIN